MSVMNSTTGTELEPLARTFRALADRKRLEILSLLIGGERCVCELTEVVGAKQPLLSFHLKTLKEAGLVTDRRNGKWVYYSLNHDTLEELRAVIGSIVDGSDLFQPRRRESICCPAEDNPETDGGENE